MDGRYSLQMFEKNSTVVLAIVSVFIATAGQLLLRAGMEQVGFIGGDRISRPATLALEVLKTPQVILGLAFFGLSAVSWMLVLSRVSLSFAYPFVGLTYVLTALFAKFILKEHVPALRWLGIAVIVVGILIVGRSDRLTGGAKPESAGSTIQSSH